MSEQEQKELVSPEELKQRDNQLTSSFLAAVMGLGWAVPIPRTKKKKKTSKCLLPGCNIETNHNGGYCCAEHCKEHKTLSRT
jgi:hypothetical protein